MEVEFARESWRSEKGLQLVHKLKGFDPEMRWLAELFPSEAFLEDAEQRLSGWHKAHPDDARALVYLAKVRGDVLLLEKAASMGDARAMADIVFSSSCSDDRKFQLALASAEKGDADGTYCLMECFRAGTGCEKNEDFAKVFMERAADLGSCYAYDDLIFDPQMKPAQKVKLSICFFGTDYSRSDDLHSDLDGLFRRYATNGSCGDVIFEVGEMFMGNVDAVEGKVFGRKKDPDLVEILLLAVAMYDGWCHSAREACIVWVLIAKRMRINKDVRKMIAIMVWEARKEARGNRPFHDVHKE